MYKGNEDFAYFAEYLFCMFPPECKVESAFSIIKLLLSRNCTLCIEDLNLKMRILMTFRNEFSEENREFVEKLCEEWLDGRGRVPFIDKERSNKIYGTVLDHLLLDKTSFETMTGEYGFDEEPAFSDSDHPSDDDALDNPDYDP